MITKNIILALIFAVLTTVIAVFGYASYGTSKNVPEASASSEDQPVEVKQKVIWSYARMGLTTAGYSYDGQGCQNMDENLEGFLKNGWKIVSFQEMNERKASTTTTCFGRDLLIQKD